MGTVAALVATFSLEVMAVEAGDRLKGYGSVEFGKRLDKVKRHFKGRNNLQCTDPQLPTYDGQELMCRPVGIDPPVAAIAYEIGAFGQMEADVWDTTAFLSINGGEFTTGTGLGELRFTQGKPAEITYAFINSDILALTIKWGLPGTVPSEFSGRLDIDTPGIYTGDLFDAFQNTLSFDQPGIQVFQP
jgi:hypothetical protein